MKTLLTIFLLFISMFIHAYIDVNTVQNINDPIPLKEYVLDDDKGYLSYVFIKGYVYYIETSEDVRVRVFKHNGKKMIEVDSNSIKPDKSQIYYIKYSVDKFSPENEYDLEIFFQKL
jgi:hypothetical protein